MTIRFVDLTFGIKSSRPRSYNLRHFVRVYHHQRTDMIWVCRLVWVIIWHMMGRSSVLIEASQLSECPSRLFPRRMLCTNPWCQSFKITQRSNCCFVYIKIRRYMFSTECAVFLFSFWTYWIHFQPLFDLIKTIKTRPHL